MLSSQDDGYHVIDPTTDHKIQWNSTNIGNNTKSFNRDLDLDKVPTSNSIINLSQANQQADEHQSKVQFTLTKNLFKNVYENKDITKLIAYLATCINTTKTVWSILLFYFRFFNCFVFISDRI